MTRVTSLVVLFTVSACGSTAEVEPRLIAGGGVSDGPVDGAINVFVIDDVTGDPIAEAEVYIGDPGSPLFASITDETGLWRADGNFNDPETITVGADGYEDVTWFGVNASNVTIPLRRRGPTAVPQAILGGTIGGWDMLPEPATDHLLLAGVSYGVTRLLGGPENQLVQSDGAVCGKSPGMPALECEWQITVPAGEVMLWVPIFDVDTRGTLTDSDDDIVTAIGYAAAGPITVQPDVYQGDIVLEQIPSADLVMADVTRAAPPADRPEANGFIGIDMGDVGILIAPVPLPTATSSLAVPALTGRFAGGSYVAGARARPTRDTGEPESWVFARGIDDPSSIVLGDWMAAPQNPFFSNAVSFEPVAGAGMHVVEIRNEDGTLYWTGVPLDGSSDMSLPDNLGTPPGARGLQVHAYDGDVDLADFQYRDAVYLAPRVSTAIGR